MVDEGGSNTIDTFVVARDGTAGPAITTLSVGGPFGFDSGRAGHLLVSDAAFATGHSGATSYDVARDGTAGRAGRRFGGQEASNLPSLAIPMGGYMT